MKRSNVRVARKTYHHGDLRDGLVKAAFALAQESGPHGVTLRAVAAKAGVSEAAPYHHFADKRALLAMAAGVGFARLDARLASALERAGTSPKKRLVAFTRAYVELAIDEPGPFRLMFGAHVAEEDLASIPEAAIHGQRVKERARDLARAVVELDGMWPGADPEILFQMVWANAHGWAWLVAERELDPRGADAPDARRAVDLACDAVARIIESFRRRL